VIRYPGFWLNDCAGSRRLDTILESFLDRSSMPKPLRLLVWTAVVILGVLAVATIALRRGEQINAMWLVVAALSTYAIGYRFYS